MPLAHGWQGKPLGNARGGPLRVIMPRWYSWNSAKWVRRIELIADVRPGYPADRGYRNEGDPWKEERHG